MIPSQGIPFSGKAAGAAASTKGSSRHGLRRHAASRVTRTVLCFSLAALVAAFSASSASALTMSFGGAWGDIDQLGPDQANLNDGYTVSPGAAGSVLTGGTVNDLLLDATGFTGVINGASGPVSFVPSQLSITVPGGLAVFNLIAPQLSQFQFNLPSGPFGVGAVVAGVLLNPALTTPALLADLAPFAVPGGSFVMTYNSLTASSSGGGTIALGPSPTASFTVVAVPEGSTLILGTSGALCLMGFLWRRRLAGNSTVSAATAS
jgi:hypothetical protein